MKARLIPISIIVVIAVLLLGGAWYFLHQSKTPSEQTAVNADEILANMVDTGEITTNLYSDGYIQLRFQIQTSSSKAKDELEKRSFQVQNIILRLASSMTEEEAKRPEANAQMEQQMKKQLNELLQNGAVVRVFIVDKVIQ